MRVNTAISAKPTNITSAKAAAPSGRPDADKVLLEVEGRIVCVGRQHDRGSARGVDS